MTPDQSADVTLTNSVVSFDGRVLELFGHASRTGNRLHLALITNIDADGDKIVITTRGAIDYTIQPSAEDEATRAEVEALIADVRQAAPNRT